MKTLKFKSNINCSGCVAAVTPFLNSEKEINSWDVNILDKNKVVTVTTETLSAETVEQAIKKAGFTAELLKA